MRAPRRIIVAARILVGKTQREVATDSGLAAKTVYLAEKGYGGPRAVERLMEHYEKQGICFVKPMGDVGWGVTTSFLKVHYDHEPKD